MVGQTSMRIVTDYTFGVIPMFLLMGAIVSRSGMSRELFQAANRFVGHWRGGLGIATIAACAGFAAISGSSVATAATFSTVAYPEMRRFDYPQVVRHRRDRRGRHAGGDVSALDRAGGVRADHPAGHRQTVHRRHPAGAAGGLDVHGHHRRSSAGVRPGWLPAAPRGVVARPVCSAVKEVWAPLLLFVFVIGGLYGGLFTPTEAGGMGAGGALLISVARGAAVARRPAGVVAAGDPHRGGGVHRADRRHPVRLFSDRHADAAKGDRVHHRPRPEPARRAGR